MANTNQHVVTGNLTRDPELRTTGSGTELCSFGLACNGFRQDETEFFEITVWGKQAESCVKFLSKGSYVAVTGRTKLRTWTTNDGEARAAMQIETRDVEFGPKREKSPGSPPPQSNQNDDIPF